MISKISMSQGTNGKAHLSGNSYLLFSIRQQIKGSLQQVCQGVLKCLQYTAGEAASVTEAASPASCEIQIFTYRSAPRISPASN